MSHCERPKGAQQSTRLTQLLTSLTSGVGASFTPEVCNCVNLEIFKLFDFGLDLEFVICHLDLNAKVFSHCKPR